MPTVFCPALVKDVRALSLVEHSGADFSLLDISIRTDGILFCFSVGRDFILL